MKKFFAFLPLFVGLVALFGAEIYPKFIDIGSRPGDPLALDSVYSGFKKANDNFTDIYARLATNSGGSNVTIITNVYNTNNLYYTNYYVISNTVVTNINYVTNITTNLAFTTNFFAVSSNTYVTTNLYTTNSYSTNYTTNIFSGGTNYFSYYTNWYVTNTVVNSNISLYLTTNNYNISNYFSYSTNITTNVTYYTNTFTGSNYFTTNFITNVYNAGVSNYFTTNVFNSNYFTTNLVITNYITNYNTNVTVTNVYQTIITNRYWGDILNKPFLTVKDFGALGDGITDDSAAIDAAIAYLQAAATNVYPPSVQGGSQGGILIFPVGHYKVSSPIKLCGNFTVLGFGMGATLIENTSSTNDTFAINSTIAGSGHQLVIRDLSVVGKTNATAGSGFNMDDGQDGQVNITLNNIRIFGHYYGARFKNVVKGSVGNVWTVRTVSSGFITAGSINGMVFTDTEADHVGGHGYDVLGTACTFNSAYSDYAGGDGFHFRADDASTFCNALALNGIGVEYATGNGISVELGKGVTINGAIIVGTTGHGVKLSGTLGVGLKSVHAETVTVTNNALLIETNATYSVPPYGIVAEGCHFYSAGTAISGSSKLTIAGTVASDSWIFPSSVQASSFVLPQAGTVLFDTGSGYIGLRANGTALGFGGGGIYPSSYQFYTGSTNGITINANSITPQNGVTDLGSIGYSFQNLFQSGTMYGNIVYLTNTLYLPSAPIVFGSGANTIGYKPDAGYVMRANVGARYPAGWQFDVTSGSWYINNLGHMTPGGSNTQNIGSSGLPVSTLYVNSIPGYEPDLGAPATNGMVLKSTTGKSRYWDYLMPTAASAGDLLMWDGSRWTNTSSSTVTYPLFTSIVGPQIGIYRAGANESGYMHSNDWNKLYTPISWTNLIDTPAQGYTWIGIYDNPDVFTPPNLAFKFSLDSVLDDVMSYSYTFSSFPSNVITVNLGNVGGHAANLFWASPTNTSGGLSLRKPVYQDLGTGGAGAGAKVLYDDMTWKTAPTGGGNVSGSGTLAKIPIWTDADTIGDSAITDDGGAVTVRSRNLSINDDVDSPIFQVAPNTPMIAFGGSTATTLKFRGNTSGSPATPETVVKWLKVYLDDETNPYYIPLYQ